MPPQTIYPNSMGFQIKCNPGPSALGEEWCPPLHGYVLSGEDSTWYIADDEWKTKETWVPEK